jgi:site-specific DNA-methyltransferase (adenine-specific)
MPDVRLIHGDCLVEMAAIPDGSIDAVVTSPPYNLGAAPHAPKKPRKARVGAKLADGERRRRWEWGGYGPNADALPEPEYQAWQLAVLAELFRVCRDGASVFYVHKDRTWSGRSISPRAWLDRGPFHVRQQIAWDRGSTLEHSGWYFYGVNEWVFWLTKGGKVANLRDGAAWGTVWRFPPTANTGHPAAFPLALANRCVTAAAPWGGVVLDPFAGSGTTGVAAAQLGLSFIATDRIAAARSSTPLFPAASPP